EGGADFLLDAFGGGFTDQRAVVAAHVGDDGLVEAVATNAYRLGIDHTVQGDQGDFGGAAADVDDHRTTGFLDRQAGTDGRSHRFLDQIDLAGTGAQRGFADRPALDLGRLAGHADQHARRGLQEAVLVHLVDEVLEHLLADAEVCNHAILHRADGGDIAGRTAEHALGFGTDRHHALLVAVGADGDDRRLVQD